MKWVQEYVIPTLILLAVSLLLCAGLWLIYSSSNNNNAGNESALTTGSEIPRGEAQTEGRLPDLGVITPIILFLISCLKVAMLIGIPGLITIRVLRFLQRNSREETTVAPS